MLLVLLACRPDPTSQPPPPARAPYDPIAYVDPLVATGGEGAQTTGVGPHAQVPFGMTSVGPDTRDAAGGALSFYHYGGYHWHDVAIDGFSHTHSHGMGVVDFGAVEVFPRATPWDPAWTDGRARAAPFDHDHEDAGPGWYSVELRDDGTMVEIAATRRGAVHRLSFPAGDGPTVVVDLGHALPDVEIGDDSLLQVDGAEVSGFQRVIGSYSARFGGLLTWFVLQADPAPIGSGAWSDPAAPSPGATAAAGSTAGAWLAFPPGTTEVTLRVALSYVDLDGARANLEAELAGRGYDDVRAAADAEWRAELDGVRVWGGVPDEDTVRTIFHTAQYHTMMMPRTFHDVDGRYRGLDGQVHPAGSGYVTDLSLWDTYRTVHPWFLLTRPDREREVLRSLVQMTEDGGALPRWPLGHGYTGGMVGSPGTILFAEAALKGLDDGWDQDAAFAASVAQATGPTPPESRGGIEDWNTLGYVSSASGPGASLTLEYAWADSALAAWAEARGAPETERLRTLGGQWRNTWDPAVGFFQSRDPDGAFTAFENELYWASDYVEGNAWHYLWTVPYDVQGMIAVQHDGDADAWAARYADYWQRVYDEPQDDWPDDWYWHGNEPVMHYAWLGSLAGYPDLTAEAARWVAAHRYSADELGLDGNDDAGTLSAWYLWAALGVYPVAGTDRYALGSPLVEHAEVDTVGGTLVIDAPGASATRLYPTAVELDGEPVSGVVTHDRLVDGHLEFTLAETPAR